MRRPRLLDLFCGQGGAGWGCRQDGIRQAVPPAYMEWVGMSFRANGI